MSKLKRWMLALIAGPTRLQVHVRCQCGRFHPGTYKVGSPITTYSCDTCGFKINLWYVW